MTTASDPPARNLRIAPANDPMKKILDVLAHPWRRHMLKLIGKAKETGMSPKEITAQSDFTLHDAGYHTRQMHKNGV